MTNEVLAVVLLAVAVLLLLSLVTYDPLDPSWNSATPEREPRNLIGPAGAHVGELFLQFFGLAAMTVPILLGLIAWRTFFAVRFAVPARKALGAFLLLIALSGFLALFPKPDVFLTEHAKSSGGMAGHFVAAGLSSLLNGLGAAIVLAVASVLTLMLTMEVSIARIGRRLRPKNFRSSKPAPQPSLSQRVVRWVRARLAERRKRAIEKRALREQRLREKAFEREEQVKDVRPTANFEITGRRAPSSTETRLKNETPDAALVTGEPGHGLKEIVMPEVARDVVVAAPPHLRETANTGGVHSGATVLEQGGVVESGITMDPDVAEMVSTASIVRTPLEAEEAITPRQKQTRRPAFAEGVTRFRLPDIGLLEAPIGHYEQAEAELHERARLLAEKCMEFSVTGHIHRINPGPVVTTFEFKPDPGIKYSRIVSLADDLCLALKAESIRIDRIPGKSTVGIEVPNARREKICLRDVIESSRFQQSESKLTLALGKTINGDEYVADLLKMPHLLIAGATGAGKSVTLNAIICSILFKSTPDDVKFIMVDPKRLELGLYEGIPHLLTPIVTDPKRAANALKWAVGEMEHRYRTLAALGVRNIEQYNRQVREMTHPTLSDDDPNASMPLPYIVIAIDELADLMMVARSEVETSIARLAQMARAVGIHLVLATQRPSVDVITGVIKANFPSRIAFRVSSKVDSRTIVDTNGAEALLGQGDMLFLPPASSRLIRVHGSFVNESEIRKITDFIRKQDEPNYNEQVTMSDTEAEEANGVVAEHDDLYEEALAIVTNMGRASTSVLQRRLSIGYGRAAKILDVMEREGFIGPADGAKPRRVLPPAYEFRERLSQMQEYPD